MCSETILLFLTQRWLKIVSERLLRRLALLLSRAISNTATCFGLLGIRADFLSFGSSIWLHFIINELVLKIINDLIFILLYDIHGWENVQSIVDASLHIFEIYFLAESFIKLKDLVSDLGSSSIWLFSHSSKNRSGEKNQLFIFLFFSSSDLSFSINVFRGLFLGLSLIIWTCWLGCETMIDMRLVKVAVSSMLFLNGS
jgi:hypothetical protein